MSAEETAAAPASAKSTRLRNDVLVTYGGKVTTLVLGLAISVVLARELGPSGRGSLAVAFSFSLILVQLGTVGLATANPFFAATGKASIGQLVSTSLWLTVMLSSVLILVGVAIRYWFPGVVAGIDWAATAVALGMIPGILASVFLQSMLVAESRMGAYSGVEVTQGIVTLSALLIGFLVFAFSATGALLAMSIGVYVGPILYLILLREHGPFRGGLDLALTRSLLGYGVKIYIATLAAFLVIRLDILLVNNFLGSADAGQYAVVASMVEGLTLLPLVIGLNLFARVARGGASEMSAEVFRSVAVLYAIFCLLSIPLASPFITLMYGAPFSEATTLYYWIVPGIYSLGMLTILSQHFAARGFPLEAMLVWFAGLAINVAINLLFLKSGGVVVASIASSVAYTALLVLHVRLFANEHGGLQSLIPRPGEVVRFVRIALDRPAQ